MALAGGGGGRGVCAACRVHPDEDVRAAPRWRSRRASVREPVRRSKPGVRRRRHHRGHHHRARPRTIAARDLAPLHDALQADDGARAAGCEGARCRRRDDRQRVAIRRSGPPHDRPRAAVARTTAVG